MKKCCSRKCSRSGQLLPLDQFYRGTGTKDGLSSECRECTKLRVNKYNKKHRRERNAYMKQYRITQQAHILSYQQEYRKTVGAKYSQCKANAKSRGLVLEITREQYGQLLQKPCFVQGCVDVVTGVDRQDNSAGYTTLNVRPACGVHNEMKMDRTDAQFYAKCKEVVIWYEAADGH